MKKLLGIVVLGMLLSGNAYAVKLTPHKPCSKTDYEKPCSCYVESNWVKKKFCHFKMGTDKRPIVEYCADESRGLSESVSKKVYKECMKDHGF